MLAERARGLLSGELSRPDEHETRRPAPRFPQPRIDDFTLKRRRGAVLAAHLLGLDEVPCIVLAHLTPAQRRAYVLADNKLALNAGWDLEMLSLEIGELGRLGPAAKEIAQIGAVLGREF